MSQIVTCPDCGHVFEVDELFEHCEKIVSELVNGKLAPPRTIGYDVIDQCGMTYQVKHSSFIHKNIRKNGDIHSLFKWDVPTSKLFADFLVLFFLDKDNRSTIFLLDRKHANKHLLCTNPKKNKYSIMAVISANGWIWNYRVSPENFMARVAELKASQQLALEFTQGFGD